MKKMMKRLLVMMMAVTAAVFVTSCESEDTDEDISASKFRVDRDLVSYSGTDSYTWSTTNTIARVQHEIKDFRSGDATIKVFDGVGRLIYSRVYVTRDYAFYVGDNEFSSVNTTAVGAAGDWIVKLSYDNFTGEQKVILD